MASLSVGSSINVFPNDFKRFLLSQPERIALRVATAPAPPPATGTAADPYRSLERHDRGDWDMHQSTMPSM